MFAFDPFTQATSHGPDSAISVTMNAQIWKTLSDFGYLCYTSLTSDFGDFLISVMIL